MPRSVLDLWRQSGQKSVSDLWRESADDDEQRRLPGSVADRFREPDTIGPQGNVVAGQRKRFGMGQQKLSDLTDVTGGGLRGLATLAGLGIDVATLPPTIVARLLSGEMLPATEAGGNLAQRSIEASKERYGLDPATSEMQEGRSEALRLAGEVVLDPTPLALSGRAGSTAARASATRPRAVTTGRPAPGQAIPRARTGAEAAGTRVAPSQPSPTVAAGPPASKSKVADLWERTREWGEDDWRRVREMQEDPRARVTDEAGPHTRERGFVQSAREAVPELEKRVAGQYVPRSTDRLAIKAKNLISDDIATAERMAFNHTDDNSVAVASELIKHYGDEAAKAKNPATRDALYDRAAEVANSMARRLTEQGRSIQAASILGRLTPEGQIKFAARQIQKYNEAVEKARGGVFGLRKKIPELTGQQADELRTEMMAIDKMPNGPEKAQKFQELQNKIADMVPSSLYQKMVTLWKAGLLTGVKTSGLNIFSNLSHGASEVVTAAPAAVADSVASLFTGKRTLVVTTKGTLSGARDGFIKGLRYMKTGFDERNIASKLDYKRVNFGKGKAAKALQKYEETVFRVIGGQDQPFYYGAKARSLMSQALAAGKTKGLKGADLKKFAQELVENPTDEMVRYAVLDAETAVFQNKTLLGKAARGIQNLPGGEVVLPFGRTPSAVATQILNYSPVGIVKTIIQNIGKGRFDQRLFSQGIGRGLTGTAVLAIGYELGGKDMVSLDWPTSERERELWTLEGKKPNSIKINGKWRSPIVLGPAGNLLLVGAHFRKSFENEGSPTKALSTALAGSAKSFTEQTFLTGLNRTISAITDPARFGEGYLGSLIASTIPTVISDTARAFDPRERRAEDTGDRLKARIPGARNTLEPQIDVLGRERTREGNAAETMLDPTRPRNDVSTPVVRELRRLTEAGFPVSPTRLGDKVGFRGLTPEQNTNVWKTVGEISNEKLSNLISSPQYRAATDDQKAAAIEKLTNKARDAARFEAETLGLSAADRQIKQLGVANGDRARYIRQRLDTMPPAERREFIADLRRKKIVTDQVLAQVSRMR